MNGIVLIVNDSEGIYIPKNFVKRFEGWEGIESEWIEDCLNVDNEYYWDSWNNILDNAYFIAKDGHVWRLHQDGDLFAVCYELISDSDYYNFFGEHRND